MLRWTDCRASLSIAWFLAVFGMAGCKQPYEVVDYAPEAAEDAIEITLPAHRPTASAESAPETSVAQEIPSGAPIALVGVVEGRLAAQQRPLILNIYKLRDGNQRITSQSAVAMPEPIDEGRCEYRLDTHAPYSKVRTIYFFEVQYGDDFVGRGAITVGPGEKP